MDPLICNMARHLRVADADVLSIEPHDEGYEIHLADGVHVLVTPHGDYALDSINARHLPRWDDKKKLLTVDHPRKPSESIVELAEEKSKEEVLKLDPPDGTSDAMLKWVGDRKDRAESALDQERRRPKPRLALIKQLERITDG